LKPKDWLAFILLGTIWGSSFLWIKIAVQEIGPILLVALRLLFAILALLVAVAFNRPPFPRQRRVWFYLTLLGLTNNALPYVLISWGEQYIDSAVAAVLNSTTPLFTMLVAHLFLTDDRMTRLRVLSLLLGFAGIVLLFSRDLFAGPQGSLLGQVAVLLASVCYAGSSVFARRTTKGLSPVVQALVPFLGADLVLWLLVPMVESPLTLPQLPITWLAVVWLGVLGTGMAFLLYFFLLHSVGPTRTALVTYIFPLVGVALGVIFLNERLDWQLMTGAAMVIASVVLVNTRERQTVRSSAS
jgi:drug/metabolite transporter (DMT)-like permease